MGTNQIDVTREEKKFIVSADQAARLSELCQGMLERDKASKERPYKVRSLYFDSIDGVDYFDKMNGTRTRKKIRLRYYNDHTNNIKLELKEKQGEQQRKVSLLISRIDAEELIRGNYEVLLQYDDEVSTRLYSIMRIGMYKPSVMVDYKRVAYIHGQNNTRITFDSELRASEFNINFFQKEEAWVPIIEQGLVVLEVKYTGYCLKWLQMILAAEDLQQSAMSKYCGGRRFFETYMN